MTSLNSKTICKIFIKSDCEKTYFTCKNQIPCLEFDFLAANKYFSQGYNFSEGHMKGIFTISIGCKNKKLKLHY